MAEDRYLEALRDIARIAGSLLGADGSPDGEPESDAGNDQACRVMALPYRLQDKAAEVAARENPVNAPNQELMSLRGASLDVLALTVTTAKYWGPVPKKLSVSFLESTPADLRARIVSHLNAWSEWCGISFVETSGTGKVRISRGPGGYWSYLGTDIQLIPLNRPTMNLQGFTMRTLEREFVRVVRHEAGHTLGFPHEHMRRALVDRIDPEKAYAYFQRTQGWSRQMVDQQVLTPLDGWSIFGTEPDQDSIMCYQLPGAITRDGQPIRGGADINRTDASFAGSIYPKVLRSLDEAGTADIAETADAGPNFVTEDVPDWAPEEDVVPAV
jgi:hypothetical protein